MNVAELLVITIHKQQYTNASLFNEYEVIICQQVSDQ